ncbi:hypothetical protein N658DRAFT_187588 [Parathielavia hyrcaniae]|uniref:Uncharacterized protein n=1 Tax=Parathielavia hyrcaniae TaxID=113614 RepID=A0AAN6T5G4_9PEZI|nr:hypothetical protein N658DRAFT_187588 [Parathielavia hyrcaniae]
MPHSTCSRGLLHLQPPSPEEDAERQPRPQVMLVLHWIHSALFHVVLLVVVVAAAVLAAVVSRRLPQPGGTSAGPIRSVFSSLRRNSYPKLRRGSRASCELSATWRIWNAPDFRSLSSVAVQVVSPWAGAVRHPVTLYQIRKCFQNPTGSRSAQVRHDAISPGPAAHVSAFPAQVRRLLLCTVSPVFWNSATTE